MLIARLEDSWSDMHVSVFHFGTDDNICYFARHDDRFDGRFVRVLLLNCSYLFIKNFVFVKNKKSYCDKFY